MATYSNLSIGSSGDAVKKLQNALINAGYSVGSTGADGKYGANTQSAVKKYQKDMGISADGIAGKLTQSALFGGGTQTTEAPAGASKGSSSSSSVINYPSTGRKTPQSSAPAYSYDASADAAYQEALAALQAAQKNAPTYANSYDGQLKELYDQIVNRDKFQYDINQDVLYKQYAEQYANKGKIAMMDTMGQAAALTGGYGSTYGQAVGQQQYDAYLQQLNDVVPELYQQAYQQYQDEGDRLTQQYALLGDLADDEYGKYQDAYNQWLAERSYAQDNAATAYQRGYNQWLQQLNQYNADREYQESIRQFNEQMALSREQFAWQQAQAQAAASSGSSGSKSSGGGGSYDADTAAMQRKLNSMGANLSVDGVWGPKTQAAYDKYLGGGTEKYTSSKAINNAVGVGSSVNDRVLALEAMYEAGNITLKQKNDLIYALKNPSK